MAVLKREFTPPGPISHLFDRLHELHFRASKPGVRPTDGVQTIRTLRERILQ
ncbi:hypothetical protein [Streptomyces sp. NPDC058694]|uniref:hypothetical protein n=1 Tax=Streptomyces sp. NPDC058694 TaxID=3346603 RepID=UPI0036616A78